MKWVKIQLEQHQEITCTMTCDTVKQLNNLGL